MLVALIVMFAADGRAQDAVRAVPVPRAPATSAVGGSAAPADNTETAHENLPATLTALKMRLEVIEHKLSDDPRFQRGAIAVELSVATMSAVRGQRSLTGASTQALRLGLRKPLESIRERSGFTVEPSIGYRTVAITASRTFQ